MGGKKAISRDLLIQENQGLVFHLAGGIHRRLPVRHEFDDLVGYGMVGLAEAANSFVPANGVKFSTYAFFRIRGAIFDGVSEACWMSRAQYRRYKKRIQAEQEKSEKADGPIEDSDEATPDRSLSEVVSLTKEHIDQLADSDSLAPEVVSTDESAAILCECVSALPRREYRLITMVYFEGYSLQDAAKRIGISKSWASRLHAKILQRLKTEINRWNQETGDENQIE